MRPDFQRETSTVFERSTIALAKWFLAVYAYIRFNTIIRQLDIETFDGVLVMDGLGSTSGDVTDEEIAMALNWGVKHDDRTYGLVKEVVADIREEYSEYAFDLDGEATSKPSG